MKSRVLAAIALFGFALAPAFAQAADGCLGSGTFTEFKSLGGKTVVLSRSAGEDYKVVLSEHPGNMAITEKIKTRGEGECLAEGDEVIMTGMGGHRAKYKIVSVEAVSGATSAAAPSE